MPGKAASAAIASGAAAARSRARSKGGMDMGVPGRWWIALGRVGAAVAGRPILAAAGRGQRAASRGGRYCALQDPTPCSGMVPEPVLADPQRMAMWSHLAKVAEGGIAAVHH